MTDIKTILKTIKDNDILYVDLRFTDPRGKLQHVSQHISTIDEESLNEGFMFDGSSIAGWKAINESDMLMKPDLSRTFIDPFYAQPTLAIFCDISLLLLFKYAWSNSLQTSLIAWSLGWIKSVLKNL